MAVRPTTPTKCWACRPRNNCCSHPNEAIGRCGCPIEIVPNDCDVCAVRHCTFFLFISIFDSPV